MTHDPKQIAIEVLLALKPDIDLTSLPTDLVASGTIDSFDLIMLVGEIELRAGCKVAGDLIRPENFASLDAIASLVARVIDAA
jgi:acyl carrier protein